MTPAAGNRVFTGFLVLASCALAVLVGLLTRENRRLHADNEQLAQALLREQTRGSLGPGELVEPLRIFDAAGAARDLLFGPDRPTLALLTSSDCPHCTDTLPLWGRVLEQTRDAREDRVSIVLIQVDADRPDQLKPDAFGLRPVGATDAAATWLRKIPISPAALWIDRSGVVRRAWHGVPAQRDLNEIAELLLGAEP